MNIEALYMHPLVRRARGVAIDSRKVQAGSLFVALPGEKTDGHLFLQDAAERGALAALVEREIVDSPLPLLLVNNTLQVLQALAQIHVRRSHLPITAITGSLGKTSTTHFLVTLLEGQHALFSPGGSINSQCGLPAALLSSSLEVSAAVLEMGMSHPGELQRLVSLFPPRHAIITGVDYVHVANHGSLEAIAREKAALFSHPETEWGLLPEEIPFKELFLATGRCEKKSYSIHSPEAEFHASLDGERGRFFVKKKCVAEFFWHLPGRHHLHNVLAAASAASLLGVGWEAITARIPLLKLPKMRFEEVEKKGVLFINDAYNACEASMIAALMALQERFPDRRRIALLGEMRELGQRAAEAHANVLAVAEECCQMLLTVGREFFDPLSSSQLLDRMRELLQPGDVVLVKGARAHRMEQLIEEF